MKNNEVNITEMRENIYENIINHNKTNIYHNKETNALTKFKKSGNFHYNSLIESNITNYYIVRLDNDDGGFLHYNQISNGDKNGKGSLSTVYLDMKLSNLIVDNLSASSAYIEGVIRVLTTKKEFYLDTAYRINFIDTALKKSEIIFVREGKKTIGGIDLYENFYIFKGNFNIKSDLMMFPLDQQKIYISFTPKDSNKTDGYLMHLQEQEDNKIIIFDKWYVKEFKPFLSKEIIMFKTSAIERYSSVSYKPVSNFEITILRKAAFGPIMKLILPLIIITLLVIGTRLHLNQRRELGISSSIYISAFAGIISIYIMSNPLIGIESIIYYDVVFMFFLAIPIVLLTYNIWEHRYKK